VLDSILPPEVNPFIEESPGTMYAFQSLFDAARADFPNLEAQFYGLLTRLSAAPVAATGHHYDAQNNPTDSISLMVTAPMLVSYVVAELKETPYDPGLPLTLTQLYESTAPDYGPVADAWISNIDFFFPSGNGASGATSVGLFESVFGADDAHYTSSEQVQAKIDQTTNNPAIAAWLQANFIYMEPIMLGGWSVVPDPPSVREPLVSDIPTLMFVGALDEATPSIFSEPSRAGLHQNYYFKIPAGHAVTYLPCADQMLDAFVRAPQTQPAVQCPMSYSWTQ
jgi:hypothetical protein